MDARTLTTKTVRYYDGNRPRYWTKAQIAWSQKAQAQRELVESLPEGSERDEEYRVYLSILSS